MAELDQSIPLRFLSGDYTKNYFKDQPLSSMMDTYLTARKNQQLFDEIERKKQAYKNVASARKGVESKYNEQMFTKAEKEQTGALDQQIIDKQAELDSINEEIKSINERIASMEMVGYAPQQNEIVGYAPQQPTRNPSIETLSGGNI